MSVITQCPNTLSVVTLRHLYEHLARFESVEAACESDLMTGHAKYMLNAGQERLMGNGY